MGGGVGCRPLVRRRRPDFRTAALRCIPALFVPAERDYPWSLVVRAHVLVAAETTTHVGLEYRRPT